MIGRLEKTGDVDVAERGARRIPAERETGFRVFADPVGHPFCLVFGRTGTPHAS